MSTGAFLSELRRRRIELRLEGDRLWCSAPAGALTSEVRDQIRERRKEIRDFLLSAQALARQQEAVVPLQGRGDRMPVFAVPGHNGDVFTYRALARQLGASQPFFGLQPPGVIGRSRPLARVEDLARHFAAQISTFQPQGPYVIAGFCAGGATAFQLARELMQRGKTVSFVALFGCPYPTYFRFPTHMASQLAQGVRRMTRHVLNLAPQSWRERRLYVAAEFRRLSTMRGPERMLRLRSAVERVTMRAVRRYTPASLAGRVCLFLPSREWAYAEYEALRWRSVAERAETYYGPNGCRADNMLRPPYVQTFAEIFLRCCEQSDASSLLEPHSDPLSARREAR